MFQIILLHSIALRRRKASAFEVVIYVERIESDCVIFEAPVTDGALVDSPILDI